MTEIEKAAFGMGCFWGPDALFGAQQGVVRTRAGYAGGEKDDPTYHDLGSHTETVMVEYDPEEISYGELLEIFWDSHDFTERRKPQYRSKIFAVSQRQKHLAEKSRKERENAATMIRDLEEFYVAEDYHQKYRLRHSELMDDFDHLSPEEFRDSSETAKANGFAAGHLTEEEFEEWRSHHPVSS